MAGGSAARASRLALAIVTLVVAGGGRSGGAGRGGGKLGSDTVSAHRLTRHSADVLGRGEEEGTGKGGLVLEEPATVAAARAPVVHETDEGFSVEGGVTSGAEHDHEVEAKEAGAEQAQQQRLPQEENTSRSLASVGRRRYGKRPRRETYASSPGLHGFDVGSVRQSQNHPGGRVAGEALQHARWDGDRCWFDEIGRPRCQANVFLFGVSKCGESGERKRESAESRSSSTHHTYSRAPYFLASYSGIASYFVQVVSCVSGQGRGDLDHEQQLKHFTYGR